MQLPTERCNDVVEALVELGRALQDEFDPRHFLDGFSRRIQCWLPHDRLVVASLSEDGRFFTIFAEQVGPVGSLHADHYTTAAHPRARHFVEQWGTAPAFRGTPMLTRDFRADPRFAAPDVGERPYIDAGLRSGIIAPLHSGGRVVGALIATSLRPDAFDEGHLQHLVGLAQLVGPFVHGAVLLQRDRIRRRRLEVGERLTAALSGTLDVRGVFGKLASAVRDVLEFDVMGVVQVSEGGQEILSLVEVDHLRPDIPQPDHVPSAEFSFAPRVLAGETVIVDDAPRELQSRLAGDRTVIDSGARSLLCIPLWMGERVGGVLYFAQREARWYDAADAELGGAIALQVALAIQHQRLAGEQRRLAATETRAQRLERRLASLESQLDAHFGFDRILGRAPGLRAALERAARVAPTETTVLITGESGTGKELVARAIHHESPRREGPFVALNCAALPESLLESELFGHEKGAFTGADRARPGRIEAAAGGTLFLDELGELAPSVQAKLLRVLQEREFTRVGGTATLKADVRIVASTNRDVAAEVAGGRFREDLYYRLAVFAVHLPPLRERGDDVLLLADHFLRDLEARMGKGVDGLSRESRQALLTYPWPGNIRELSNAIERAMILSDGGLIRPDLLGLPALRAPAQAPALPAGAAALSLPEVERQLVHDALARAGGNKSKAAKLLGLTRSQLYTRLKRIETEG